MTADPPTRAPSAARLRLAAELALLYLGVPALFWWRPGLIRGALIPSLVLGALGMVCILLRDPRFDRRRLWNAAAARRALAPMLARTAVLGLALGLLFARFEPERLFDFPRRAPLFWLLVCLLYPVLSVYPQEIIFRVFFFHRYRPLLGSERALVAASALAFGAAHVFFGTWIAPLLSLAGGALFARTYARTRSALAAGLEHALWGDLLFTLGLGWYFYTGSIG